METQPLSKPVHFFVSLFWLGCVWGVGIGCVKYCYQASDGAGWRLWVPITLAGEKILHLRVEKSSVMGNVGHLQLWILPNPPAPFWKFYSI